MAIIEIGNLYSTLKDATLKGKGAVDSALAVDTPGHSFVPSYKSGMWDGKTRFFKMTSGKFPTGLLSDVVRALARAGEVAEYKDLRNVMDAEVPDEICLSHAELGSITLRDYQYESVWRGLQSTRGIINVATNGGKTEIACGIIQCIMPKLKKGQAIAFFTHSKEIFNQSHKRLQERLGIEVGMIGNGKWDIQQVNVIMIPTLAKYLNIKKVPKNANKESFEQKCKDTKQLIESIVAFLGDEVHHASSSTWYDLFMKLKNAYYRFGLTGTVDESDQINLLRLLGCTGKIVTKVSNDYLIGEGHSAKPTIYMMELDTETVDASYYLDAKYEGIIFNENRNELISRKIIERTELGKQSLVIVNETQHGDILYEMLDGCGFTVEFVHGEKTTKFRDESLEAFKNGEIQVLIATTILDEGVDVSGINCLFLAGGGKSMRQLLQRIGRGLRKKADGSGIEVYDVLDYHNEHLARHTLERYKVYKSEGFDIIKLEA
jgi:superfamily II DNA or RNA helicase